MKSLLPICRRITESKLINADLIKVHPIGMTDEEAKDYRLTLHKRKYRLDKIERILERIKGK